MRLPSRALLLICSSIFISSSIHGAGTQPTATVQFTLDFQGANPSHYEITVAADGPSSYTSDGKLDEQSGPGDPAPLAFTLSDKTRSRIFDLAKRAHYFTGKVDSGRKNLANTGAKTLIYKDEGRNSQATYNYSSAPEIQQLTEIFQSLSTTLEYGRRLSYFHRYEKLALEQDLKRMEELQRENSFGDIQAIAPVLKQIADDPSVITVTRSRALRLLSAAQSH
jgi:hypothetical protein